MLGRIVSRRRKTGLGAIRSQAQDMRAESNGELAGAIC